MIARPAGRLFEGLKARFGQDRVFIDVAGIEPGRDFRRIIDDHVGSCDVLLALIGKNGSTPPEEQEAALETLRGTADDFPKKWTFLIQLCSIYAHLTVTGDWPMLAVRQNSPAAADGLNSLLVLLSSDEVGSWLNPSVQSLMLQ
jgi:hypothetical protein